MKKVNVLYCPGIDGCADDTCWNKTILLEEIAGKCGVNYITPPAIIGIKNIFTLAKDSNKLSDWYSLVENQYRPYLTDPESCNIIISYSRGTAIALQLALKYSCEGLILVAPFLYNPTLNYDILGPIFEKSEDLPLYKEGIDWNLLAEKVRYITLVTDKQDITEIKATGQEIRTRLIALPLIDFTDYQITSKDHFLGGLPELEGILLRMLKLVTSSNRTYHVTITPVSYYRIIAGAVPLLVWLRPILRKKQSFSGFSSHLLDWNLTTSGLEIRIADTGKSLLYSLKKHLEPYFEITIIEQQ